MIEQSLYAYLKDHPLVSPFVTSEGISRVFPLKLPSHVPGEPRKVPALVYQQAGLQQSRTFCGTDKLELYVLQLDSYGVNYGLNKRLAKAAKKALVDYSGLMGDTRIDQISMGTEFDLEDPEPGLFRVSQTYEIWYIEE